MKISRVLIRALSTKLDKQIKLPGLLEIVDGPVIRRALTALSDRYWHEVPEVHQTAIIAVIEAYVADDFSEVTDEVVASVEALLDAPWVKATPTAYTIATLAKLGLSLMLRTR